ncbi:MAG: lysyl oxidase family protein [Acidobacteriota bacterium]|nr:lysyl oxidase family protein [Acidobacteriota bacterium]
MRGLRLCAPFAVVALILGGASGAQTPDLVVDAPTLATSWFIEERYFPPGSCALVEGCVDAPGVRKLLRFSTMTANSSMTDLDIGDPAGNPLFSFSPCHGHYHFEEFADYQLLDTVGAPVAPGHKQAFCLVDSARYILEPWVPLSPSYSCSNQGIQRGWSDVYGWNLDCQWIDVSEVPNGSYTLEVTVNPELIIPESDDTNNTSTAPVTLTDVAGLPHRPDGRWVPGGPLVVDKDPGGERVVWDATTCPSPDFNLFFSQGQVALYSYTGSICSLGTGGDAVVNLPDPPTGGMVWFVVADTDPGNSPVQEGGHGFDSLGAPRPLSGVGLCGVQATEPKAHCN